MLLFFTVGKMFCLRGGVEHRVLKLSQLKRMDSPNRYIYYENVSKNHNGSFKQLHVKSKVVPLFACPEAGDWCPVKILIHQQTPTRCYCTGSVLCT